MIDIPLTDDFLARLKTESKLPSGWSWTIDSESHTALTSRFEMKEQRMTIKTVRLVNEQHIAFLLNGEPVQPVGLPSQFQTINLLEAVIVQFDALKVCNGVIGDKSLFEMAKNCATVVRKNNAIKANNCLGIANAKGEICRVCCKMRSYLKARIEGVKKSPKIAKNDKVKSLKRSKSVFDET